MPGWTRAAVAAFVFALTLPAADIDLKEGQPAPDFKLQDASGAEVRLSALKGKVVLLDFWADLVRRVQSRNSVVHGV